ncbi:hypothetical protein [Pedobacter westerhofensis]|nr:hypothetical protein [Pedobacter westerhofensis]
MKKQQKTTIILCALDPVGVPLYINRGENEMTAFNLACEFCGLHSYSGWRENTHGLYLLRGGRERKENLMIGLLEVPLLPKALEAVTDRLRYYNQYGEELYTKDKKQFEDYRDFIIRVLSKDCSGITDPNESYTSGYGGSHIWIAERSSGRRVLMMHF